MEMDMNLAGNPEMGLSFDPSFFDSSILSTINWLPNELFTPSDQRQTPSIVSQQYSQTATADGYTSRMAWQPPVISTRQMSPPLYESTSQTSSGHISLATDMGSPRNHSHVASELSPNAESVDSAKRSTDYYVDGGGARLPKYRKKQAPWSSSLAEATSIENSKPLFVTQQSFGFPGVQDILMDISDVLTPIEAATYDKIHDNFLLLCCNNNPFFENFDSENFPGLDECTRYIACFFDSFQTVYPMLHFPTFNPNKCHWLLTLAVVAIGCHFSNSREMDRCAVAFHEMIRRAFCVERKKFKSSQYSLDLIQAMLLNCIGLLHSGNEEDKLTALSTFSDLVALLEQEQLLKATPTQATSLNGKSDGSMWRKWIQNEIKNRTGYCIWLLDSTLAYYFEMRPHLSLDDGQAALPVHDKMWQADSAETWKQQWLDSTANESLFDAVHILYIEKRLISGIGEFSHILLIHALYHRMWEVGDYFRRPLSFWNPTAKKQSRETAIPTGSVWLPGIPSYSKWRNSACDCLDILHWTANSTIAKAAGLEHPTVLHLHASRLVLLAPFREIRSLATSLATEKLRWSKRHQVLEWQYIWRWVKHDQYKARLSIVHAGVTLWHVRRYSTNAFHEPVAAFLAVLTLWAYGTCHTNGSQESSPHSQAPRAEPLQEPSFIHLDRPCDDELVQLFVREGHVMRGNVTGVGDICAPEGPERILRVGCETLSRLTAWGLSKEFIRVLTCLADIMMQHRGSEHGTATVEGH
ncbi:hypothetical protein N7532_005473 [Penicillium argentinense]|uniref:Xylanolytic transcriptional activator regulatory domain-containing protein n=1 Tax=Penicillium argentinense TaxID=1131581 RepID=A0A9W9FE11_9EURO|nr:uncharacterized protein N7532_005473 [Penicillium argentinense]KAJ5098472.1 hypothetical protein N7532_005473 [Penicillium argentinense]